MADAAVQTFSYHRAVAPLLWVFVALSSVELVVDELLIAHWSRAVALIISVLTLGSLAWLVGVVLGFRRRPVLITPDALVMRVGALKSVTVPLADIAGLRRQWDGADLKRRGVLNLALLAYPNIVVDLRAPRLGRRKVAALAHRLDDPAAFAAALTRALG